MNQPIRAGTLEEVDVVAAVGERLASVAASLARQEWIFAKTMPENPHEYCLRRRWVGDDDGFVEAVQRIREAGYEAYFGGHPYTQLDIGDHFYWTMRTEFENDARGGERR